MTAPLSGQRPLALCEADHLQLDPPHPSDPFWRRIDWREEALRVLTAAGMLLVVLAFIAGLAAWREFLRPTPAVFGGGVPAATEDGQATATAQADSPTPGTLAALAAANPMHNPVAP